MPCYDSRSDDDLRRNARMVAILCGVITKNGLQILDNLDYKEIGVPKTEVLEWWKEHEREDRRRRAAERTFRAQKIASTQKSIEQLTKELNTLLKKR